MEAPNHVLDEPCKLFGRGTQKSPSGFIAFIRSFRNDRENLRQDAVWAGANPSLQLNPVAFECFENLVSEIGILARMVLRQTEDHRLSADIVSAPWITEDRTESTFTGERAGGISPDHSGTGSGYDHETRRFSGCGKRYAEVGV